MDGTGGGMAGVGTTGRRAAHGAAAPARIGLLARWLDPSVRARRAGDAARDRCDWRAARDAYGRSVALRPDRAAVWVQYGHTLKEGGELAAAEAAYRQALSLAPHAADTHLMLGHALKLQGRAAEAREAYRRAAELDPADPAAAAELAAAERAAVLDAAAAEETAGHRAAAFGDWAAARAAFGKVVELRPDRAAVWVQYGHALKESGEVVAAEAAYRRAASLAPRVADTHVQLGHALKLQGRAAEAREAYRRAAELDPGDPRARAELEAGRSPAQAATPQPRRTAGRDGTRPPCGLPGAAPVAPSGKLDIVTTAQLRELRDRVSAEGLMRARCMAVPVDAATAICRVLGRYKMYVDARDVGFAPHLMFEGCWEYWITDFVWRNLRAGEVALDVGANCGYYTVLFADLVGADGVVHAIEPNPRLAELLNLNVLVNGFARVAQVHAFAACDRSGGTVPLVVPVRDLKNGFVLRSGEDDPSTRQPSRFEHHEVPARTLDEAVPGRVDFIKVDVEGAEELVWRGMQRLIGDSPGVQVLMEFNAGRCREPEVTLEEIAAQFPLREIRFDGLAAPCTAAQVLERREDTMLYLSERDPS